MSIKYSLIPSHLTADPEDHMAIVQDQTSRTIDDIIDAIANRGSTVTKADILSVVEEYQEVISNYLADGDSINIAAVPNQSVYLRGICRSNRQLRPVAPLLRLNVNSGSRLGEIAGDLLVDVHYAE